MNLFIGLVLIGQPELFIHIIPDKTNNTLSIIDNGIGMTKAAKIKYLVSLCEIITNCAC